MHDDGNLGIPDAVEGSGMTGWIRRMGIVASVALAAGLSGCVSGGPLSSTGGPAPSARAAQPSSNPANDRLHQQARAALARWADAVAASGIQQGFVPVGELTGQIGDWEASVGDNNKRALMAGLVQAAVNLPSEAPPDGELRWQNGATETVRLLSAQEAISAIRADGNGDCSDCAPLQITGARLTTGPAETSRGPATAPTWEFRVQGTSVRLTRVAIAARTRVVPPPWNPNDAPVGISIESAAGTVGGRTLTVGFTGAPDTGDRPCGEDYTAEAVESPTAVVVIVTVHPHAFGEACAAVGAPRTAVVALMAALGERAVLEIKEGLPVSVQLAP
jgi:hypothetical protein